MLQDYKPNISNIRVAILKARKYDPKRNNPLNHYIVDCEQYNGWDNVTDNLKTLYINEAHHNDILLGNNLNDTYDAISKVIASSIDQSNL